MPEQIIEIAESGRRLSKRRGFIEIYEKESLLGKVSVDDVSSIIISTPGCSVTTNLMDELSLAGIPLVICGKNYLPSSVTIPLQGHQRQFKIMQQQGQISEPRRKRAWQKIIQAKITNQMEVLERAGQTNHKLKQLVKRVGSGDPENIEAQAARIYWQCLFGSEFRRDRNQVGLNAALNYAYTVLRACVARGVCAAGLHPSFSLHHKSARNPFNLVDDLIQPLRPMADYLIYSKVEDFVGELNPDLKQHLAGLLSLEVQAENGIGSLSVATAKMCQALVAYYFGDLDADFTLPMPSPLAYHAS